MTIQAGWPSIGRYLFIDGSYLRTQYEKWLVHFFGHVPPIDFRAVKNHFEARKVFYYDGLDEPAEGEESGAYEARIKPQLDLLSQIRRIPGFHVFEGSIRGKKGRRRQKKVDVQLTVDALTHAFRKNADEIVLIAGDLDFEPLVTALIQLGTYVTIAAERSTVSKDFAFSGDHYRELGIDTLVLFAGSKFARDNKIPSEFGLVYHGPVHSADRRDVDKGTLRGLPVLLFEDVTPGRTVPHFQLQIHNAELATSRVWDHSNGDFLKKYVTAIEPDIKWD